MSAEPEATTVRAWLVDQLTPVLPAKWRLIENQRMPETIDRITVVLKHTTIERLPEAPIGQLRHTVILTVVDPHQDAVKAENALDQSVIELVTAIDGLQYVNWTGAAKVAVTDTYLGWDITLTAITGKE